MSDGEIEVPDDAGEHADGLAAILRRFEPGWTRWLDVEAGWYPIITKLDTDLSQVAPDYVIQQIKEKYGTLRYYAEVQSVEVDDEVAPDVSQRFDELIREAEEESARVCERCGSEGVLCTAGGLVKTLCTACCQALELPGGRRFEPLRGDDR